MSDITFSMSADEKDVTRALQATGKEFGKLRDQIASMAAASDAAGKSEMTLSQQRLAALNPLVAKQKELKAAMEDAAKQLKDGKISQEQYNAAVKANADASDLLTQELRKLQTQVQEDNADMKKAAAIVGQVEDKTEKYARAVAELDRMKAKGILTSKQHAAAIEAEKKKLEDVGSGAEKSGGLIGGLTGKMGQFVAGLASMSAIVATIRQEYDLLLERQGKSKDANISLATQQEALLMNLGGADAGGVLKSIRELSTKSGVKEENVTAAVNDAMAARADLAVGDVVNAVGSVSKIRKLAPTEMAGLAAATIDTQKQTGLGTDQSLGFLLQLQGQARTKNLKSLAENFTPAVGGVMNFGADRQTAGAMLSALSHGMGDTTGAMTATSAIQLSKQLREFAPGQDIGKSIEALQRDPAMRQKFLANASFEAKALPAIESLLGGGTQAKQFAAAKQALSADPMTALSDAIKARDASPSIGVAEQALAVANVQNQAEVKDTTGAKSAINREAIAQMRIRAGRLGVSTKVLGMFDDAATGGVQTAETQQQAIQAEIARLEAGKSDKSSLVNAGASALLGGPLTGMLAEKAVTSRDKDSEFNKEQIALLKEMLTELQRQTGGAQAGVVAGRRNNQGENAP